MAPPQPSPKLPPGPRAPAALQSFWWSARPESFLSSCRRRFGDTFTVRLTQGGSWVFLSRPADAAAVFTADPGTFVASGTHEALEPLFGSRSVHLLDGAEHLRQRRLLMPPLHGEHLERYAEVIAEVAAEQLRSWPLGEEIAVLPRTRAIALEVIMRGIFGFAVAEGKPVRESLDRVLRLTMGDSRVIAGALLDRRLLRLATRSPLFAFRRAMSVLDDALFAEIRRRRSRPEPARQDMLSLLLRARDEGGRPLDDEELKDNLVTLVVAGHETTATGIAWALHFLARSPEALAELPGRLEEDSYLESVARETLRLRPPVPLSMRRTTKPFEVSAGTLPPGTRLGVCIPLLHRAEEAYPDAGAFRPARFCGRRPEGHAWAPFGGGTRRCLGSRVAMLEMKIVLRAVLGRYRLEPVERGDEAVSSLAMRPARNGLVTFRPLR
jgi:cytochrome P450 family 135